VAMYISSNTFIIQIIKDVGLNIGQDSDY